MSKIRCRHFLFFFFVTLAVHDHSAEKFYSLCQNVLYTWLDFWLFLKLKKLFWRHHFDFLEEITKTILGGKIRSRHFLVFHHDNVPSHTIWLYRTVQLKNSTHTRSNRPIHLIYLRLTSGYSLNSRKLF